MASSYFLEGRNGCALGSSIPKSCLCLRRYLGKYAIPEKKLEINLECNIEETHGRASLFCVLLFLEYFQFRIIVSDDKVQADTDRKNCVREDVEYSSQFIS